MNKKETFVAGRKRHIERTENACKATATEASECFMHNFNIYATAMAQQTRGTFDYVS